MDHAARTPEPENDHAIVIERPHTPVELGDLLLEYNRFSGPAIKGQVIVTLSLLLTHVSWSSQKLTAMFFLTQTWSDSRLAFAGDNDVEVGSGQMRKG